MPRPDTFPVDTEQALQSDTLAAACLLHAGRQGSCQALCIMHPAGKVYTVQHRWLVLECASPGILEGLAHQAVHDRAQAQGHPVR